MKKIAYDKVKLDSLKVIEDNKSYLKVAAVITKEGVYKYPDGRAFKCRKELLKAVPSAMSAKLTILDHPDSMVIMSQDQIYGFIEKPFFDNDKIRAVLAFNKKTTPPDFLEKVRAGLMKDVSIGFYYRPEFKTGQWNGATYDYIMRDIVIDHVAAGVLKGRCSFPSCGIGVDTMMRRIGLDPFAEYKDFADCVSKNQESKSDPEAYCAWLHKQTTGKTPAEDNTVKGGKNMKPKPKIDYGHAKSPEEIKEEFDKCVAKRMEEGAADTPPITKGQAEALCQAETEPADEPGPHPEQLDQEDFEACVTREMKAGLSREEAESKCKPSEGDQEAELTPMEKCVNAKMSDGVSREDAEAECRKEHPVGEGDQEDFEACVATKMQAGLSREEAEAQCKPSETDQEEEPTLLEKCLASQKEQGKSDEAARAWCEEELAGEHQEADALISESQELLKMKREKDILERKSNRRHPL